MFDSTVVASLNANLGKLSVRDRDFANSLLSQWRAKGRLSEKQQKCVCDLANRAMGEPTAAKPAIKILNFDGVVALFDKAQAGVRNLKIRLELDDGRPLMLTQAGPRSSQPGTINVTDGGPFGANIYYGRIARDGAWTPGRDINEVTKTKITNLLMRLAANPQDVALEYSRRLGNCCFCGRQLVDPVSVKLGYGPICAERWNLPHGD